MYTWVYLAVEEKQSDWIPKPNTTPRPVEGQAVTQVIQKVKGVENQS